MYKEVEDVVVLQMNALGSSLVWNSPRVNDEWDFDSYSMSG